ncbi:hypothetical protein N7495_005401 [Penicillium taxi]|uniref:uncharacterized protein n=1 Tax=Penicillium taxi TaxID=168475 RepID=UPI00254594CB|nr:uncharacterized protein N7495_005401 [Penicillium taxi]KAJ5893710.1 hypothetical protein N7495_005401 [Penicillium taxi]
MLSRVARQKNALFNLRKANAHRVLGASPTLRLHSTTARIGPSLNTENNKISERRRRPSFQSHRSLATAADPSVMEPSPYTHDAAFSIPQSENLHPEFFNPYHQASLLILADTPKTQSRVFRKVRGVGGDEDEMMANFEISLRVRRFDRAAALLNRLGTQCPVESPEYLNLHNRYLKEMVSYMIITRQSGKVPQLQRWFEVDMPAGGVKPDATTYSVMIRMSLRLLHGSKRERSVRRYWELAKEKDLHEELLASEVLSDFDLGELVKICSADLGHAAFNFMSIEEPKAEEITVTDNFAEVLATSQRGLGLSTLKKSLSLFSDNSQLQTTSDNLELDDHEREELQRKLRQKQLEADTVSSSLERWRYEFEEAQKSGNTGKLSQITSQWVINLQAKIEDELRLADEAEGKPIRTLEQKNRAEYAIFLRCLSADRLAAITILAVMNLFSRAGMEKGLKLSMISSGIGREVQDELVAASYLKKNSTSNIYRKKMLKELLAGRKGKDERLRWKKLSEGMQEEDPSLSWSSRVTVRLGAALMSLLFDVAKTPVKITNQQNGKTTTSMQPAFLHGYEVRFGRRLGLLHMHPQFVQSVTKEPSPSVIGRHLPMVSTPQPWTGIRTGGYLLYTTPIVRSTPGETLQPAYIKAALENGDISEILKGLDVLGSTGWVINEDVFQVMLEAWNSGKEIGNLAPLEPEREMPPQPGPDADYATEKQWQLKIRDIENEKAGLHSQRCFQNFQLEVARAFRKETFYLPHNMDFRGRAYPLPPYLNQMGADNARGLLLFSKSKPLGASGLRWLKIQVSNLAGFDKASMSEREQFAMDNLDLILDSANNGLHGKRWWLKAEDPWQCLAACCELRNAMRLSDPTKYESRLPIHQDGSCNGLQHYAALGGDLVGAQQVNLEPSDRPSDVYTGVSEYVKQAVTEDAANGHAIAKLLEGRVTRKIVKQTVMTNVYGVTFIGAMRQVRRQLNEYCEDLSTDERKAAAIYISRKIFGALGTMFNGAHDIQYWLGDCASRITQSLTPDQIEEIAKDILMPNSPTDGTSGDHRTTDSSLDPVKRFRSTVIWTTPLGLPVVQPYRTRKSRRVSTTLQDINIVEGGSDDVISRRKQLQAFPPNFIHSLDATHMMLSAIACKEAGLEFSAVHDSFWTHAGDVDSMNKILREAFVKMHSDDIIGRLGAEFDVRFSRNLFLAKVNASSKIGKAILQSRETPQWRNSMKVVELIDEHKRQTLLRSEDPVEQAEGREMETPASIFEAMDGADDDLCIPSTLGSTGVGHVPDNLAAAERRPDATGFDSSDPALEGLFGDFKDDISNDSTMGLDNTAEEATPQKKLQKRYVYFWMPLKFRSVPKKGDWDLQRIHKSEYFFS